MNGEEVTGSAQGYPRDDGIDMLRVVSMLMVVCLHVLSQGGVMVRYSANAAAYDMTWLLESLCFSAVNVYGLISGWVGVTSRWKISRILELYLTVWFYAAGITLIARGTGMASVNGELMISSLLPLTQKTYWYFSAYVGVFFLAPFLNRMVLALSQAERVWLMRTIFAVFIALTMVPKAFGLDPFTLVGGFSFCWLLLLYVYGACMRLCPPKKSHRRIWYIAVYVFLALISWLFKIGSEHLNGAMPGKVTYARMLITYHAPTIFLCAVCLLRSFSGVHLESRGKTRLLRSLSAGSFSVYLIHVQPLIWAQVLKGAFSSWAVLDPRVILWPCIGAALLIFLACSLLDVVRRALFRLLRIRQLLRKLDERVAFPCDDAEEGKAGIDSHLADC